MPIKRSYDKEGNKVSEVCVCPVFVCVIITWPFRSLREPSGVRVGVRPNRQPREASLRPYKHDDSKGEGKMRRRCVIIIKILNLV